MKTPEEIKKELVEAIEEASWVVEGGDAHDLIDAVEKAHASMADTLAYIQQLEMLAKQNEQIRWERDVAIDQLKQLGIGFGEKVDGKMPKWISVEEALPKYGERVLITEGACVFEAYRSISNKWVRHGIGWAEDVTHWMPLPEPPKEG